MLDDEAIERYARQIVIPGVGAAGQERLLASCVLVAGNERGCRQAELYLRAAGVRVVRLNAAPAAAIDVVVIADSPALCATDRSTLLALAKPICWYAADERGFTSGVHPSAPLPATSRNAAAYATSCADAAHDAAACDAAAVACAMLIGLAWRSGPFRFEI